jgi:hypothetical protein
VGSNPLDNHFNLSLESYPINISFELEIVTSSCAPMVRSLSSGMKGFGFKSLGESFQSKVRKFFHKYKFQIRIVNQFISLVGRTSPCGIKGFWVQVP